MPIDSGQSGDTHSLQVSTRLFHAFLPEASTAALRMSAHMAAMLQSGDDFALIVKYLVIVFMY